jgi:hypothetical protein
LQQLMPPNITRVEDIIVNNEEENDLNAAIIESLREYNNNTNNENN